MWYCGIMGFGVCIWVYCSHDVFIINPVNASTKKRECAFYIDTLIDIGGWLGVPSVECKERTLIVRANVLHHLGVSCIARVYTVELPRISREFVFYSHAASEQN